MISVFDYSDYRGFINAKIKENAGKRGYQGTLAKYAGCQSSFLSQVLSSNVQLTLDHGAGLSEFWGFNSHEAEYFLDLIAYDRASTKSLRKVLSERMEKAKTLDDASLKEKMAQVTNSEELELYFSAWYWAAIHLMTSFTEFQTTEKIAKRLNLDVAMVEECLGKLAQMEFVQKVGASWKITKKTFPVAKNLPLQLMQQKSWFIKANNNQKFFSGREGNMHGTVVRVFTESSYHEFSKAFAKFVANFSSQKDGAPSEVVCLSYDLFKV